MNASQYSLAIEAVIPSLPTTAHLILCDPNKVPLHKWKDKSRSNGEIFDHARQGGLVALVPWSIGLAVIDIDEQGASKKPGQDVETILGPPLAKNKTRGGGWHLWYKPQKPCGNAPWVLPNGVGGDLRCQAGYVVLWDPHAVLDALGGIQDAPAIDLDALPRKKDQAKKAPTEKWDTAQAHPNASGYPANLLEGQRKGDYQMNALATIDPGGRHDTFTAAVAHYWTTTGPLGWEFILDHLKAAWQKATGGEREPEFALMVQSAKNKYPQGDDPTTPQTTQDDYEEHEQDDGQEGEWAQDATDQPKKNTQDAKPKADSRANRFARLTEKMIKTQDANLMAVEQDTYVADPRGLWHPITSKGGHIEIYRLIGQVDPSALTTGRDCHDVAKTLQVRCDELTKVERRQLNRRQLLVGRDQTWDASTRQPIAPDTVRTHYCTYREPGMVEVNGATDESVLNELKGYYGTDLKAFRYFMRHRIERRKRIALGFAPERRSSVGKTMVLDLLAMLWGDSTSIADNLFNSNYNGLEIALAKHGEVVLDEADKHKLNPAKINAATQLGEVSIDPKHQEAIKIVLRGTLVILTAAPIGEKNKDGKFEPFPWHEQGILPDKDGHGGRIKDAYCFTNDAIPEEYGIFIGNPQGESQRKKHQTLINTLGHWLLSLDEIWPDAWNEQAKADLNAFVAMHNTATQAVETLDDWKSMLPKILEKREGSSVRRAEVELALMQANIELPPSGGSQFRQEVIRQFDVVPRQTKKGSILDGVALKTPETE